MVGNKSGTGPCRWAVGLAPRQGFPVPALLHLPSQGLGQRGRVNSVPTSSHYGRDEPLPVRKRVRNLWWARQTLPRPPGPRRRFICTWFTRSYTMRPTPTGLADGEILPRLFIYLAALDPRPGRLIYSAPRTPGFASAACRLAIQTRLIPAARTQSERCTSAYPGPMVP